jgi:opacity protein-like surface antigen
MKPVVRSLGLVLLVLGPASAAQAQTVIKPVGPGPATHHPSARIIHQDPPPRVIVSLNYSYLTKSDTFTDTRTFDLYQETARFTADYDVEARSGADLGGYVRLWGGLAAGVAYTTFKDDRDIAISGTLPHPFLFNHDRSIDGTTPGTREENAVHVDAAFIVPLRGKLQAVIFGGPTFFTVRQSVVTDIDWDEAYPYDTATFRSATVAKEEESKTGFNVGADVSYYFTHNVGVGGIVRFSSAKVKFSLGEVDAGGAMIGGGVRFRF